MEPFKNKISEELVYHLGNHIVSHWTEFDQDGFTNQILAKLDRLELKQRIRLIADVLHQHLPMDLTQRFEILGAVLHPDTPLAFDLESDAKGIRGWGVLPLTMVVSSCGLNNFPASFALLKEMTKRSTAEFDVRPFIEEDQDQALAILASWIDDDSPHVRRLITEGTRPRLPWGLQLKRLVDNPEPALPLLEVLTRSAGAKGADFFSLH